MKRYAELNDPECGAVVCVHILKRQRPALLILRSGRYWQVLCGHEDHVDERDADAIHIRHVEEIDPTFRLSDLPEIPINFEASRASTSAPWMRERLKDPTFGERLFEFFHSLNIWRIG